MASDDQTDPHSCHRRLTGEGDDPIATDEVLKAEEGGASVIRGAASMTEESTLTENHPVENGVKSGAKLETTRSPKMPKTGKQRKKEARLRRTAAARRGKQKLVTVGDAQDVDVVVNALGDDDGPAVALLAFGSGDRSPDAVLDGRVGYGDNDGDGRLHPGRCCGSSAEERKRLEAAAATIKEVERPTGNVEASMSVVSRVATTAKAVETRTRHPETIAVCEDGVADKTPEYPNVAMVTTTGALWNEDEETAPVDTTLQVTDDEIAKARERSKLVQQLRKDVEHRGMKVEQTYRLVTINTPPGKGVVLPPVLWAVIFRKCTDQYG
ncbi:hypothetical protein PI125_g16421 [Phytophthora idaei]|nr:hypothetical protein PI125_g16421 [Phytophthora idaei]